MSNPEVRLTLREAVDEMTGLLLGYDLQHQPEMDKFQISTRFLNMALRRNALEREWGYYASTEEVGTTYAGLQDIALRNSVRMRIILGDSVRLEKDGRPVVWAYVLQRDSLPSKSGRSGLWVSVTKNTLTFSRPLTQYEEGLTIMVPVMREPKLFRLPVQPMDPSEPLVPVPDSVLNQEVDFDFPDVIVARAAFMYAQADPVMQPRVQTLEGEYKDLMYQLIERDDAFTDPPDMNEYMVPIQNSLDGNSGHRRRHPHADERRY